MKRAALPTALLLAAALAACGKPTTTPDAGYVADDSCGLDCAVQKAFGLVINRCFEYSDSATAKDPADLGVLVRGVKALEGDVKVLEVEYRQSGQILMTDNFQMTNGRLLLARRTFRVGDRVQYEDASGNISGVPWARPDLQAGETANTTTQAGLLKSGQLTSEATKYKVTSVAPDPINELTTPLKAYESGVKLIFEESPDHRSDSRRIWVRDLGFAAFSSPGLAGPSGQPFYRLQKVRDLGPGVDGGDVDCGFGSP